MSSAPPIWFVGKCRRAATSHYRLIVEDSHHSAAFGRVRSPGDVVFVGMGNLLDELLSQCCSDEELACNMLCLSSHVFPALRFSSKAQSSLEAARPCVTHPAELYAVLYRLYSCLTSQLDRQLSLRVVEDFSKRCDDVVNQVGMLSFAANLSLGDVLPLDNSVLLQVCGEAVIATAAQEAEWTSRRCVALRIRQKHCTCAESPKFGGEIRRVEMSFFQIAQRLWKSFQLFGQKPDCENDRFVSIKDCPVAIVCRRFRRCDTPQQGNGELCSVAMNEFAESMRYLSARELLNFFDRRQQPPLVFSDAHCEAHSWEDFLVMMRTTHELLSTSEHQSAVVQWAATERESRTLPLMAQGGDERNSETALWFKRAWLEAESLPDETEVAAANTMLSAGARERLLRGGTMTATSPADGISFPFHPTASYSYRRKTIRLTTRSGVLDLKRPRDILDGV